MSLIKILCGNLFLKLFRPLFSVRLIQHCTRDNLTAVLYGINDLRLEQRPIPKPRDDEVLLQIESVGICGSDVHYLVDGRIGDFIVKEPMVIGHEASGTVVQLGQNVTSLQKGDRVAIEPGVPCRLCPYCKKGRYNLCSMMRFCATPPVDGNLTRFFAHPADFCFKLADHISLDEGALLEPLSVGVRACKVGQIGFGSTVLILGSGPVGLVTLLSAKAMGASFVVNTDTKQHRLDLATELGADAVLKIRSSDNELDLVEKFKELFCCDQPTVTVECSGADKCFRLAVQATKMGGKAVLVGMGKPMIKMPLMDALCREIDIYSVFRYVNDYPTALEMVASGKIDVNPIITHHFKLEDSLKAFETTKTGAENCVKVIIHANPEWEPNNYW